MTLATFIPEVWAQDLLSALQKATVIAAPGVVNRDYEGEITQAGDTVHINSIGDPTIATYTPGSTTITPEQLTSAQQSLVVDQAKYFAFEVDDVDARQAKGNVLPEAMRRAAYKLRDTADIYVEALLRAGVASANALGTISVATASPTAAYDNVLIPLKVALDEANVPQEGRYVLLPPWVHGRMLRDDRFIRADATGAGTSGAFNGTVGMAAGFSVRFSNNLPIITGDDYSVIAGVPDACSYAEQINKVEAYRPQDSFSDAVKGLHLYGAKVTRPDGIATATVSKT